MWKRLFGGRTRRHSRELQGILDQLREQPTSANNAQRLILVRRALESHRRDDDPKLWSLLQRELALRLIDRPDGDRTENVEEAIAALKGALEVRTRHTMPVEWARTTSNLSFAYIERIAGDHADNIDRAIALLREILEVRTREIAPAEHAGTQMDLASAYVDRRHGDRAENLEYALACYDVAINLFTEVDDPFDWAIASTNRANTLFKRIRGDRRENLEKAITGYLQAVQIQQRAELPPWRLPDLVQTLVGLADAYEERVEGDPAENVKQALHWSEAAIKLLDPALHTRDWATAVLRSVKLLAPDKRGDVSGNVERAIGACEAVLAVLTPEGMPLLWVRAKTELAGAYANRVLGSRQNNIQQAVRASREALAVVREGRLPGDWRGSMMTCANAMVHQGAGEDAALIEEALACFEAALDGLEYDDDPHLWCALHMNMANAFMEGGLGGRNENIQKAIEHYELVLASVDRTNWPDEWALTQSNLATAWVQLGTGNRLENFAKSLAACEAALTVYTRERTPDRWAATLCNAANVLMDESHPKAADRLEEAIEALGNVCEVWTTDTSPRRWAEAQENLGIAYRSRVRGDRIENLERASAYYQAALEVQTSDAAPAAHLKLLWGLGATLFSLERWRDAAAVLRAAFDVRERLYQLSATERDRTGLLFKQSGIEAQLAFSACQLRDAGDLEDAVVRIERGRARAITEQLALEAEPLDALRRDDRETYLEVKQRLRELGARSRQSQMREQFIALAEQNRLAFAKRDMIVARIRTYAPTFLAQVEWRDIEAIAKDAPLIYITATEVGGCGLIVDRQSAITPVILPDLTRDRLHSMSMAYLWGRHGLPGPGTDLDDTLQWLWNAIVSPLLDRLGSETQVVVIATGLLGLLPLHAAWMPDPHTPRGRRVAMDNVTFRYAPNVRTLQAARAAHTTPASTLLAVQEPLPVRAARLRGVEHEVAAIRRHFQDPRVLKEEQATRETLLKAMPGTNVIHFGCHGVADLISPLDSGLLMAHDQRLSLRDILDLRLTRTRLAVLSACETAVTGGEIQDEVLSLPAGLLVAGAAGVIGSLWPVSDAGTTILMARFYEHWKGDGLPPSEALARAQRWMYQASPEEHCAVVAAWFDAPAAEFLSAQGGNLADPSHWAAFCFTGA